MGNQAPARYQSRTRPEPSDTIRWDFRDPETLPPVEGSGHFHWTISAFQRSGDDGMMFDTVTVDVEAPDEELAIARAMRVIQRNYYRVSSVRETCSLDSALRGVVDIATYVKPETAKG